MKEASSIEWIIFLTKKYFPLLIEGTCVTLNIAIIGSLLGFLVGFLVGLIKKIEISKDDKFFKKIFMYIIKSIINAYVEIFRDTPIIVQAMVIYYGFSHVGLKLSPLVASILTVLLNTGSYMAETVRAGIISIDNGQSEGAIALGMSNVQTMIYVVLPQAFKNIIPEMANQFLMNLKATSVLNVVGISELYMCAKTSSGVYYRYFESYLIIAAVYFILCFISNKLILLLEKKLKGKKDYALAAEYINNEE